MVFLHQTLDGADTDTLNIKNATQVRSILESDGSVMAVFSGHNHSGASSEINGIHYFTLEGSIEGGTDPITDNAFSLITVSQNDNDPYNYQIDLQGYGRQDDRTVISQVVPEPATMSLLAIGGMGVMLKRRRRRA